MKQKTILGSILSVIAWPYTSTAKFVDARPSGKQIKSHVARLEPRVNTKDPKGLRVHLFVGKTDIGSPQDYLYPLDRSASAAEIHDANTFGAIGPRSVGWYRISSANSAHTPDHTPKVNIELSESSHFGFVYYLKDPTEADTRGQIFLIPSWYVAKLR